MKGLVAFNSFKTAGFAPNTLLLARQAQLSYLFGNQRFFSAKANKVVDADSTTTQSVTTEPLDATVEDAKKTVELYQRKRNAFYRLGYNENHIENQKNYEKARKQRLDQWENPPHNWPPYLPRPTMHSGKTLLLELEKEYMEKIKSTRPFKVPNYRTGDVVDVTIFRSLSEGKFNKHRGLIYSMKNPNSLDKSFKIHFNEAEQNLSMMVKEFSPMVAKIDVHKYGSNQSRKKLNHIPTLDLSKTRVTEPIIKGRGFKPREKRIDTAKAVSPEKEKGRIKRESTKLDAKYEE